MAITFGAALIAGSMAASTVQADHASFKDEIFPIIKKYCVECHQPGGEGFEKSGLDVRTYEGIMKGTRHGPIVVPGDAFSSNLNVLIEGRASPELKMPHARKGLTRWERHMIRVWVNRGAKNN
jgi:hypothetical protein